MSQCFHQGDCEIEFQERSRSDELLFQFRRKPNVYFDVISDIRARGTLVHEEKFRHSLLM